MPKRTRKADRQTPLNGVLKALNQAGFKPLVADDGKYELAPIKQPRSYRWKPEHDITAYELARAIEVVFASLMQGDCDVTYDNLPDGAKRHFEVRQG